MSETLLQLAERTGAALAAAGWRLVTAESCTGGGIAHRVTDIAGSSDWFDRGFVTYSDAAKQQMLGVLRETLDEHGAVSAETVEAMALGALEHSEGDVAVAVSGVAGPGGGSADKPVGLVWFAWATRDGAARVRRVDFGGDRAAVRDGSIRVALEGVIERTEAAR